MTDIDKFILSHSILRLRSLLMYTMTHMAIVTKLLQIFWPANRYLWFLYGREFDIYFYIYLFYICLLFQKILVTWIWKSQVCYGSPCIIQITDTTRYTRQSYIWHILNNTHTSWNLFAGLLCISFEAILLCIILP